MSKIFIIEHLEPELGKWCMMEYVHMSEEVGKDNIWFTNIPRKDTKKLEKVGNVFDKSVGNLALNMKRICVLDPDASETLNPERLLVWYERCGPCRRRPSTDFELFTI